MPDKRWPDLDVLAAKTLEACRSAKLRVTTAESCTGGLIIGALTEIGRSSDVVGSGFITYSNEAKMTMLGVSSATLESDGAVSQATVRQMTFGALNAAGNDADIAVSVSGVAGPGGGSKEKPVGTVWIAVQRRGEPLHTERQLFPGNRRAVRQQTVIRALELIMEAAKR